MIVSGISLVLEGGGMRGMFSAGVFEAFMQKELIFPHIVGVSAGACNIVSYMSQQPLRTRRVIQNYVGDKRYCSLSNWLRTRSLFGFDFILKELPQNLLPFDYEAFRKYPGQLYVGTTDVITGKPVWYTQGDMDKDFLPLRASASLPFFAPVVTIDGHDFDQIESAFAAFRACTGKPTAILMHTIKGKGVKYMENNVDWHGKAPNDAEYEVAMNELRAAMAELEA